jgi:molecular chaperone Hsp33
MVQTLPFIEEEDLVKLENTLNNLKSVSDYFNNEKDLEEIAKEIFSDFDIEVFDRIPVSFDCDCSEERMEQALISLGKNELKKIIEEDGKIETVCHFCNKKYMFEGNKLINILKYIEE